MALPKSGVDIMDPKTMFSIPDQRMIGYMAHYEVGWDAMMQMVGDYYAGYDERYIRCLFKYNQAIDLLSQVKMETQLIDELFGF